MNGRHGYMSVMAIVFMFLQGTIAVATECVTFSKRAPVKTVTGRVTDPLGEYMADVEVTLTADTSTTHLVTKTDTKGRFHFHSIPRGDYTLVVRATGYLESRRQLRIADCSNVKCGKQLEVRLEVGGHCPSVFVKGFDKDADLEEEWRKRRHQP